LDVRHLPRGFDAEDLGVQLLVVHASRISLRPPGRASYPHKEAKPQKKYSPTMSKKPAARLRRSRRIIARLIISRKVDSEDR
ncbi:MAG TPA: hypothetical protein VGS22_06140, partial [Thermoanaerobaculia bacterium]|nr:hypothetical protein [Thermoanaerobaculia bacterium]